MFNFIINVNLKINLILIKKQYLNNKLNLIIHQMIYYNTLIMKSLINVFKKLKS